MGGKKQKLRKQQPHRLHSDAPNKAKKPSRPPPPPTKPGPKKQHKQVHRIDPTIPFEKHDRILLVGEGDLSFAASLVRHHGCTNVTATVLEKGEEELKAKYPHVQENIDIFLAKDEEEEDGKEDSDQEAAEEDKDEEEENEDEDDFDDWPSDDEENNPALQKKQQKKPAKVPRNNRLAYNIDATKPLPNALSRQPYNHILFNFPHVGGLSTDINRQVRHNQSLLSSFLQTFSTEKFLAPKGSIVITLFEGEPYTLWNIRDLARHAGLGVETSFKFEAGVYPGYKHARTLGVVNTGKKGGQEAWRGEERKSRSFVIRRKEEVRGQPVKKKRKKEDDSDDEED